MDPKQKIINFIFSPIINFCELHSISFLLIWIIPYLCIIVPILQSKRIDDRINFLKIISVLGLIAILAAGVKDQITLVN